MRRHRRRAQLRTVGAGRDGNVNDSKGPGPQSAKPEASNEEDRTQEDREHDDFTTQTGYRAQRNQVREEPVPASRHDDKHQEAVTRNGQWGDGHPGQTEPEGEESG
jgi:hypothetical protein